MSREFRIEADDDGIRVDRWFKRHMAEVSFNQVSRWARTGQIRLDGARVGPGDRIGLVGVNGAGKTTLLNLFDGSRKPDSGRVKQGKTLRLAHLRQEVDDLDSTMTVLESVNDVKARTKLATGRDASATDLLEGFGFTGQKLVTRIGDLSGGERRRLQLLRLLMDEPNVLLLDEPTNDLDVETLGSLENALLDFPGCAVVISHDRWFLDRVATHILAYEGTDENPAAWYWFEGNFEAYEANKIERLGAEAARPHRVTHRRLTRD